jgi:exosome complex RNA-binding protein Rrp42 (RNase PH superfamily)
MSRDIIRVDDSKLKYLNVHHIPVCCTFYFLGDDEVPPIIDASAKEERLSKSRLSIVMNTYEDVCGMSTFGGLDID